MKKEITCGRCGKKMQIAPTVLNAFNRATNTEKVTHLCKECERSYYAWVNNSTYFYPYVIQDWVIQDEVY